MNGGGVKCRVPKKNKICRLVSERRCSTTDPFKVRRLKEEMPSYADAFDVLRLNGKDLEAEPYTVRKGILGDFVKSIGMPMLRVLPHYEKGFVEQFNREEEGLIIKKCWSRYLHARVNYWLKAKHTMRLLTTVVGFRTDGTGKRANSFRSLVLTVDGEYVGNVGGGFTDKDIERLMRLFREPSQKQTNKIGSTTLDFCYVPIDFPLQVEITACDKTVYGIVFQPRLRQIFFPDEEQKTLNS